MNNRLRKTNRRIMLGVMAMGAIVILVMLAFLLWAGTKPKADTKNTSDSLQLNIETVGDSTNTANN